MNKDVVELYKEQYSLADYVEKNKSLAFVTVDKKWAVTFVEKLKRKHGYKHFVLLTAVDFIEDGKFQLTYLLNNPDERTDLGVRVFIDRDEAEMESMHHLWPTVATYQRELREMFGINFPGSPRVNEPFILEGWEGIPPYRRDFKTKEFAESFFHQREGRKTYDPATYMKEKLYPNE